MKIGLLTSYRAQKQFEKQFKQMVAHLEKRGHIVVHNFEMSLEKLLPLTYPQREKVFLSFYEKLEGCDLVIAECSLQSTQVGFGLSYLRTRGKPIVILSKKGSGSEFATVGELYSTVENMMIDEYSDETIPRVLDDVIAFMEPHLDKRFTIIFPASLLAKVEDVAKKKKLPKAVYIRQLIEKDLKDSSENQ
ncbi:MAG TPA: hypothetical protein VFQ63_02055 [Patescibacteria group bacterium]|nr:hypothetical protein [Patescibacteria group bacterium]